MDQLIDENRSFKIASFNLHGLNNGRSMLYELCSDEDVFIIVVKNIGFLTRN